MNCLTTIQDYTILKLKIGVLGLIVLFDYHTRLHHSQTSFKNFTASISFDYHTRLHHSQTPNKTGVRKMKVPPQHRNLVQYSFILPD